MARIVVLMLPEAGHLLPTFKLARALLVAGHQVTYLTVAGLAPLVVRHGFHSATIVFSARAGEPSIRAQLEQMRPDIVLLDQPFFAGARLMRMLAALNVATLAVNSSVPDEREGGLPPGTSHGLPGASWADRLLVEIAWGKVLLQRWWYYFRTRCATFPPRLYYGRPEVVLCSRSFDFPRPSRADRHYLGPSIDSMRPAGAFPWHALDPGAKLIYCSFGSQTHRYKRLQALMHEIIDAVAMRKDEQLVMSVDAEMKRRLNDVPSAVIVTDAPQIQLLQRASVVVMHGGLGGIKESILFGVPMVVFPQDFDQPGNAARVAFHRVGVRCLEKRPSAAHIRALIDTALTDTAIRSSLSAMQDVFRSEQRQDAGVAIVESYIAGANGVRLKGAEERRRGLSGVSGNSSKQ